MVASLLTAQPPRLLAASYRTTAVTCLDGAWNEWSLRDVGLFDGAFVVAGLAGVYALAQRDGEQEQEADAAVTAAEERVRLSVENSPCNGPSIEALEALEAADAAAAKSGGSVPTGDPNELAPLAPLRSLWPGRRGGTPRMQVMSTSVHRRHALLAAVLLATATLGGHPEPALAVKDCFLDCTENCNRVAKGSFKYCESSCGDYCNQDDRRDGLSGSVDSSGAEVGLLSAYDRRDLLTGNQRAVPYGEDKPPAIELPSGLRQMIDGAVQQGAAKQRAATREGAR